jgi:hypothetical protein
MALDKIKHLENQEIIFSKIRYKVTELKEVTGRLVIKTDKRTFTFYPSEVDDWLEFVAIVDLKKEKEIDFDKRYEASVAIAKKAAEAQVVPDTLHVVRHPEKVAKNEPLQAEIMQSNQMTANVSDKLFEMFEKLANEPSESDYKKATAMVSVSHAIINAQLTQLKFLTLKK